MSVFIKKKKINWVFYTKKKKTLECRWVQN